MYRSTDRWQNSSANPTRKIPLEQSAITPQTHNLHFLLMQISPSQGKCVEEASLWLTGEHAAQETVIPPSL